MMEERFWNVKPMSAHDSLRCLLQYRLAVQKLCADGCDVDTAKAVGENAAVCACSLWDDDGARAFEDVWEVLDYMTLGEIARYAREYSLADDEWDFNRNFAEDFRL